MKKKLISLLLTLCMVLALLPTVAFADPVVSAGLPGADEGQYTLTV